MESIPVIIPAYEPDDRLIVLLRQMRDAHMEHIILVNDGSGPEYDAVFEQARELLGEMHGALLRHDRNCGKGRALKTAFAYLLEHCPEMTGAVTADSDGQHTVKDIQAVADALSEHPGHLILGVRSFEQEDVPWKSRCGNRLTKKVFRYVSGLRVSDTQTGLRGIPRDFMRELLPVKGERFEFETEMLLESVGKYPVTEVPIETVYDSRENHQTHFNSFTDSVKIYRILMRKFLKYLFASFSSFAADLILFTVFCMLLKPRLPAGYIMVSTAAARLISAVWNYLLNYRLVFKSRASVGFSAVKYTLLAVIQMICSALLTTLLFRLLPVVPETAVKCVIDMLLFFISYFIQQRYVFAKSRKRADRT